MHFTSTWFAGSGISFHMNGSLTIDRTKEKKTGTMPLAAKAIATGTLEDQENYKLMRAKILLYGFAVSKPVLLLFNREDMSSS